MLFDRLLSKRGSTPIDSDVGWNYMSGGMQTQAGVRINEQTALGIAAVEYRLQQPAAHTVPLLGGTDHEQVEVRLGRRVVRPHQLADA